MMMMMMTTSEMVQSGGFLLCTCVVLHKMYYLLTYMVFLCSSEIKYVQLKMPVLFKQKHDFQLVTQHYASGCAVVTNSYKNLLRKVDE